MSEINACIGNNIRQHRKARGLTLQELAESIHKSRATVSKYETGDISLDISTLYDISSVLEVPIGRLIEYKHALAPSAKPAHNRNNNTFFRASRLYFYFYDGRYGCIKDGVIDILPEAENNIQPATLTISVVTPNGRSSEIYYSGKVTYSDMLIRFSFANQYNAIEEDLLYIFNPLEFRNSTYGLLSGISSADLRPCAFRCLVTLSPYPYTEELKERLLLTKKEIRDYKKLNMLVVDNIF